MSPAQTFQNMKQLIIVNAALQMPKEKLFVHIAEASAGAVIKAQKNDKQIWLQGGSPKILLKVLSEDDLQDLLLKADRRKLPTFCARNSDGIICIGIGPICDAHIQELTILFDFYIWVRQNPMNVRSLGQEIFING